MPLLLTTPYQMGEVDQDYTHVKIQQFEHRSEPMAITMRTSHGSIVDGAFVAGLAIEGKTDRHFRIDGADYIAMVTKLTSATGVPIYGEVARELYRWLIDGGHFDATIV